MASGWDVDNKDFYGNYKHYHEIIDKHYERIFEKMRLDVEIASDFKIDFCLRFYDREIGFETFSKFLRNLEVCINSKCYNLFRMYDKIRKMDDKEMINTIDITTDAKLKTDSLQESFNKNNHDQTNNTNLVSDNKALNIVSTQPQKDLSILFPNDEGVIKYADTLQDSKNINENKQNENIISESTNDGKIVGDLKNEGTTRVHGWQGRNYFETMNDLAEIVDIKDQIFNIMDNELFLSCL